MESPFHRLRDLFAQLGLPDDPVEIEQFIQRHAPIPTSVRLEDAAFWTPAQATFLRDAVCEDSDWVEVVDHLSAALRGE